jgi:hypothetical protein
MKMVFNNNSVQPSEIRKGGDYVPDLKGEPVHQDVEDIAHYNSETMPDSVKGAAVRKYDLHTASPYHNVSVALNNFLGQRLQNQKATLTILGDPTLDDTCLNQTVRVYFYYPHSYRDQSYMNELHYTSGDYALLGITHTIDGGQFFTKLELQRVGLTTDQLPNKRLGNMQKGI